MNKKDKEFLEEKLIKLFNAMNDQSTVWIKGIKQINELYLFHDFEIQKNLEFICPYNLNHIAYTIHNDKRNVKLNEDYGFYQNRKQKFELRSFKRGPDRWFLFSRWSKLDVQDFLEKLDLKIVEII